MPSFLKREGKRGTRWTARVRLAGRRNTKTFATKAAAEKWARTVEGRIELRDLPPAARKSRRSDGNGYLLSDAIADFLAHRKKIRRAPGKTFANALARLEKAHGLEPLDAMDDDFWMRYTRARLADGRSGSTVSSDLAYAVSVLRFADREGRACHPGAPAAARREMREDGVNVESRKRTKRISDPELKALRDWMAANPDRTSLPLADIVEFALATGMRRGEIMALEFGDIQGRIAKIKRKHPRERDRVEDVPLLKVHPVWPQVDPIEIIERQPKTGRRVFPYLADTLGHAFEQATKGAKLRGVVFHLLRHECLSRLAERGFDPLRLAMVGGHRDLRNVARYAKLDPAKLANE